MNFSTLLGFCFAAGVLYFGVFGSAPNPHIFMDPHALILVMGGTVTVSLISFPIKKLFGIMRHFFRVVFLRKHVDNKKLVQSIVEAAAVAKANPPALTAQKGPHPFLTEAFQMVGEGVLGEADLFEVLSQRSSLFKASYAQDAKVFQALSKYPPAFGLLGAVTGMIAMMMKLGTSNSEAIGAAMGIALIATFWGIATANLLLLPLADFYGKLATDDAYQRSLIVEGAMMLKRRESPIVITEKLNSFLSMDQRISSPGFSEPGKRAA